MSWNLGWLQSGCRIYFGVCHPASQGLAGLGPGLSLWRSVWGKAEITSLPQVGRV